MTAMNKHNAVVKNVYLEHIEQDAWNDMHAYHIEKESAWRNVAILAITALVIVTVYSIYMVSQDKHKVVVFEKDGVGNITTLGIATKSFGIDNKIIAHQLANFIIALREVPVDINVKRRNIDLVHKMIDPKLQGIVDKLLVAQYTKAHEGTISVNLTQIKPIANGNSWSINWIEKLLDATGNIIEVTSWSSSVTFKRLDLVSPEVQLVNPIGLFITYIHPVQDINNKDL